MASEVTIAREGNKQVPRVANKALNLLKVQSNRYTDANEITVMQTPSRNWRLYYKDRDTGLTVGRNNFSAEELDEAGLLIR